MAPDVTWPNPRVPGAPVSAGPDASVGRKRPSPVAIRPATLPTNAWKEYGNDWNTAYHCAGCFDPTAPATFPGINSTYAHGALTYTLNNVLAHGFLYVKNALSIGGGGNLSVWGSLYLGDSSSLDGSHVKVYYDDTTTVRTMNVSLSRQSWQEITGCSWSGTHPTCP